LPDFAKVEKKYREKGIMFVGFTLDEKKTEDKIKETLKKAEVEYTNVYFDRELLKNLPEIQGIPATFLVGADGEIVDMHVGSMTEKELVTALEENLPVEVEEKKGS
jgi:hypothetical protein